MDISLIELKCHEDSRGGLVVAESSNQIPFNILRMFYIYGVDGHARRGFHAHKETRQVLICISGSCRVLLDDGKDKETVLLNNQHRGLLVEPHMWHEMYDFVPNTILVSLASTLYDEKDYLRDYDSFLKHIETEQRVQQRIG